MEIERNCNILRNYKNTLSAIVTKNSDKVYFYKIAISKVQSTSLNLLHRNAQTSHLQIRDVYNVIIQTQGSKEPLSLT